MLPEPAIERLRERLLDADYTLEGVAEHLGQPALDGLARNSTMPLLAAVEGDDSIHATMARLWMAQDSVTQAEAKVALGDLAVWVENGMVDIDGDQVRATVVIRPYGAEASAQTVAFEGWVAHDPLPNLNGRQDRPASDFVLGVSPASTTLAQLSNRRSAQRALDLGTGCGVQSLHLAQHADHVVSTDINQRALATARLTGLLNEIDFDLREGSLYEPVANETFDLIVSNPPFVMSPPTGERLIYREGSHTGDDLVRDVVMGAAQRLTDGGTAQFLCNWANTDQPWEERLASWIEPGRCDAFVIEREKLDVFEYIEMWLADAGVAGAPNYRQRFRAWLDYFDHLGITGVSMGWISLYQAGRAQPKMQFETWPHAVHQPVGAALAAHHNAADVLAGLTMPEVLNRTWRVHPGVVQETLGRPGAADPEYVVLRQNYGLGRALKADTATAALVGACDGDLTAMQLIAAIANLFDVDVADLTAELGPKVSELVAQGYLIAD